MSERCLEIGLLLYPGVQLAAVYGLGDLFSVANRRVVEQNRHGVPTLRISHWQADEAGSLRRVITAGVSALLRARAFVETLTAGVAQQSGAWGSRIILVVGKHPLPGGAEDRLMGAAQCLQPGVP